MTEICSELDKLRTEFVSIDISMEYHNGFVHHYTSPEGLCGIINSTGRAKLWFTQYDSLNDRSEKSNTFEFIHGYCDLNVKEGKISQEFCDTVKSIVTTDQDYVTLPGIPTEKLKLKGVEGITEIVVADCDTYLCCFSDSNDLLPMWNYYSKSQHYEGYCVSLFTGDMIHDFEKGYRLQLRNVIYDNRRKKQILDQMILPLNNLYRTADVDEKDEIKSLLYEFFYMIQFVFKDEHFSHEREVRAILRVPKDKRKSGIKLTSSSEGIEISERKYRNSNGYIVPYVEVTCPPNAIKGIMVAPLLEPELAANNLKCMLEQYDYGEINITSSKIPIRF